MSEDSRPGTGFWRTTGRAAVWPARSYGKAVHAAFNGDQIRAEGRNIQRLWRALRTQPPQPAMIMSGPGGEIDITLTAEVAGVTAEQVEWLLALRMRRTADTFCASVTAACFCLGAWLLGNLLLVPGRPTLWSVGMTALMITALGLIALQAALQNWQVRARRIGSLGDYLAADDLLPRRRGRPGSR